MNLESSDVHVRPDLSFSGCGVSVSFFSFPHCNLVSHLFLPPPRVEVRVKLGLCFANDKESSIPMSIISIITAAN